MHMQELLRFAWKWANDAPRGAGENVKVVVHILFFSLFYDLEPVLGFSLCEHVAVYST